MKKILCAFFVLSLLFVSCNSEDLNSKESENKEVLKFSYLGNTYRSTYQEVNDTLIQLDDPILNKLYQEIQELPELATFINEDGSIDFYKDYNSLEKVLNTNSSDKISERSGIREGSIILYSDCGRGGKYITLPINDDGLYIPDLGVYGFDDTLSSFYANSSVFNKHQVVLFRDKNYGGRSIGFVIPLELYVGCLKDYRMSQGRSWNDRASSFIVK